MVAPQKCCPAKLRFLSPLDNWPKDRAPPFDVSDRSRKRVFRRDRSSCEHRASTARFDLHSFCILRNTSLRCCLNSPWGAFPPAPLRSSRVTMDDRLQPTSGRIQPGAFLKASFNPTVKQRPSVATIGRPNCDRRRRRADGRTACGAERVYVFTFAPVETGPRTQKVLIDTASSACRRLVIKVQIGQNALQAARRYKEVR